MPERFICMYCHEIIDEEVEDYIIPAKGAYDESGNPVPERLLLRAHADCYTEELEKKQAAAGKE